MKNPSVTVTDRAVVRFLETVVGLDLESVRDLIRSEAANGVTLGATGVRLDGVRYRLSKNVVVTVSCRKPKPLDDLCRRIDNVR